MKKELEARKLQNQVLKWYLKNFAKSTSIKTVDKKVKLTQSTQKKKTSLIKRIIIPLNLLSLLLIFSCGSDTVNNVTVPPTSNEITLLSIDSLTLRIPLNTLDTNFRFVNNDIDSLKITFTAETNCVSGEDLSLTYTVSDTTNVPIIGNTINNLQDFNQSYTYYTKTVNLNYYLHCALTIFAGNGKYVKFKNLKLIKFQ